MESRRLLSACRLLTVLLGLALLGAMPLSAWAMDVINFYNGQKVTAHVTEVSGDVIFYRQGFHHVSTKRLRLINRVDAVETRDHLVYVGEIHYLDPMQLEIITSVGKQVIWRYLVKSITLGLPHGLPTLSRPAAPAAQVSAVPVKAAANAATNDAMDDAAPAIRSARNPMPTSPDLHTAQPADASSFSHNDKPLVHFPSP